MPITARILTRIDLPKEVRVEIEDTVRGEKVIRKVDFEKCLQELGALGTIDLHETDPAELLALASALAKHRAVDEYLLSIGVDPHEHLKGETGV
jgi:hypothetical protein